MEKQKEFKERNLDKISKKEVEMAKKQQTLLLKIGWTFVGIGIFLILLASKYAQISFGRVLLNVGPTGIFVLVAGVLSLIIYFSSK